MARWAVRVIVALGLALFALGLAVLPLQAPSFTRSLASRHSRADAAGLSAEQMLEVAEAVRGFVVQGAGRLPERVDGREGFDRSAVAHLVDVRRVLRGARVTTALLAVALALWFAFAWRTQRGEQIEAALGLGAIFTVALPLLAMGVGALDFDAFFAAFHGIFFASGTWTFPGDSLLILAFPEPFWVLSGLAWGIGVLAIAGAYALAWALLRRRRSVPAA